MDVLFHQAALGDFVLTFPILRGLGGDVAVVAPGDKAALAARVVPGVTPMDIELWEFTRLWTERGPSAVSPAVRELFERAERIVSFVSDGSDAWGGHVRRLAPGAKLVFVPPRPPADWREHVTAWHAAELRRQGVALTDAPVVAAAAAGPVIVHPGSGGREKCWPAERFEALIAALRKRGRNVVPVWGEAEAERWPEATRRRWETELAARPLRSLGELYDLLRGASLYVGNDSGPTHLAAQLGVPTVALFGPSDPVRWRPIGPRVAVLAPPDPRPMEWLSVEAVFAAC